LIWRKLREKAFYYGGFFFGGLWFFLSLALALLRLLFHPGDRNSAHLFADRFCGSLTRALHWKIEVENRERIVENHPCVFIANHQSFLDVVTYGAIVPPRTLAVGKKEIRRIPLFGWFFRASGNLLLDRGNTEQTSRALEKAGEILRKENVSVWFMPEGHRNLGARLLQFKTGAFRLAIAAKVPIVALVAEPISVLADTIHHRARPGTLRIRVLDPIFPGSENTADLAAFAERVRAKMQAAFDELRSGPSRSS
jgi:1-acyl-sn-glycerol-3-phosphate acyltransferase